MIENQQTLDLPETLGYRLRRMREAKKVSIDDAADQLCLSVSVISAIEKDQYTDENNTIFMRGHIRSYAKLLWLPKEEVQATMIAMGLIAPSEPVKPVKFKFTQRSAKDKSIRFISYGIIVLLVILVVIWRY